MTQIEADARAIALEAAIDFLRDKPVRDQEIVALATSFYAFLTAK